MQLLMQHPFGAGHIEHRVSFHDLSTSGEAEVPEPLKVRIVCHFLLSQIPDEGMAEALETLVGMWLFYRTPVSPPPALPAPVRIPVELRKTYVRPVFPVTEE